MITFTSCHKMELVISISNTKIYSETKDNKRSGKKMKEEKKIRFFL